LARRTRSTFKKRQKEIARQQKQQDKQARRLQKKEEHEETTPLAPGEDPDISGTRIAYECDLDICVHDLATGRYMGERAPVLIVGPCGTGKSHLAQALGHCAVRQGVDVVFGTCAQLTASLNAARATGAYDRKLTSLARVPLLIIDDFGLKPLRPPADEDLHDLIAERYEQVTTVVTSNLDFTEWDQAFPSNRLLASATLDRLRHNAYCLVLDGHSYRAPKLAPANTKSRVANNSKTTHA